jgi:hypothetical protein
MFKRVLLGACILFVAHLDVRAQIITGSQPYVFVNGTIIDATQVNADYAYIINQINANGAKNGPNNDIIALLALITPLAPVQGGSSIYYAPSIATGTVNDITINTVVPTGFTRVMGKAVRFRASGPNTGAVTLSVNGTTAGQLWKATASGVSPLSGGELQLNQEVEAYWDGSHYQVLSGTGEQNGGFGLYTDMAAATTTDLGAIPSHNVHITGSGVNISSLGSTASAAYPVYWGRVDGVNTLVGSGVLALPNNAASMTLNAGDQFTAVYAGSGNWRVTTVFPAQVYTTRAGASGLRITNNAGTPNTRVDITASELVMVNGSGGNYRLLSYGTCTVDFSTNGAGGLDAGTIAANTWYYLYAIGTGSATSCIAATGPVAPLMPTAFTYLVRLGAIRTDSAAATLWPVYQAGAVARFKSAPATAGDRLVTSGAVGTCGVTVTSGAIAAWGVTAPGTARDITVSLGVAGSLAGVFQFPMSAAPFGTSAGTQLYSTGTIEQEATVSYIGATTLNVCSQAGSTIYVDGWTDTVNAN